MHTRAHARAHAPEQSRVMVNALPGALSVHCGCDATIALMAFTSCVQLNTAATVCGQGVGVGTRGCVRWGRARRRAAGTATNGVCVAAP